MKTMTLRHKMMKTNKKKDYCSPYVQEERISPETGFAESGYTLGGGGKYDEDDRNDNGTI